MKLLLSQIILFSHYSAFSIIGIILYPRAPPSGIYTTNTCTMHRLPTWAHNTGNITNHQINITLASTTRVNIKIGNN